MGKYFNWPPFKLVALDADTGKPLDPNVGMRVKREFYDIKKDDKGNNMVVAHKTNGSKAGVDDVKKNGKGNGNGGAGNGKGVRKNDGGNCGAGGGNQKPADAEWTADEDAKLKAMKADNKTWKEIVDETGRQKHALQARFKEIKDTDRGDANAKKKDDGGKKSGKDKSGGDEKGGDNNDKKDKKTEKVDKHSKPDKKQSTKAPSKTGSSGEARFTMREWMTLQEDDMFSFGELQCLSELLMKDETMRWMRIASVFFDKTGRRVHPEDIKEKFAEMGALGS